ncbi:RDAC family protein [Anaeromicropila herbilytica]|uniref:Uncharacterized protein n=1 Tax=Anaeromicropila herbilytica TaxID=2785025 RepID=A0A7R7EJ05_9FIRM|nr:hypothetical protein [Anaeromicropila herbilytica]BCN29609.1 hypothetical protein bsdtb5_09040 [Anaeromicropila herbilytica]
MTIISITMIIEINRILSENQISLKVHLRDACGKQSMWIEDLSDDKKAVIDENSYELINQYFEQQHIKLEYSNDKLTFWVAKS